MKLSELTPGGIKLIKFRLEQEQQEWQQFTLWRLDFPNAPQPSKQMMDWYALFTEFRDAVMADEDMDEAFARWVRKHHNTELSVDKIFTHPPGLYNVPQYGFMKAYEGALMLLEAWHREEQCL